MQKITCPTCSVTLEGEANDVGFCWSCGNPLNITLDEVARIQKGKEELELSEQPYIAVVGYEVIPVSWSVASEFAFALFWRTLLMGFVGGVLSELPAIVFQHKPPPLLAILINIGVIAVASIWGMKLLLTRNNGKYVVLRRKISQAANVK